MVNLTEANFRLIAKDKATQAFVESYNAGLPDDDFADFAHLQNEDTEVMIPEETQMDEDEDVDDEEEYRPEEVSTSDLKAELRKVAKGETVSRSSKNLWIGLK